MPNDPRVDAYIEKQADFARPILRWYRDRVHAACPAVDEVIKWGRPFFYLQGRPLAMMSGFKAHAVFGIWNLDAASPNTGRDEEGERERYTSIDQLPPAETVEGALREAVALIESGHRAARPRGTPKGEAEVPDALAEALANDETAAATFDAFPPSCRREYSEWIAEAKRDETRAKRVAQTIEWLREGKRRNWKYESC